MILHFDNSYSIYIFGWRILSKIPLMYYQEHHLFQCAKWCNPVISEVVASCNHTYRLYKHLGSILLWPCVFQILSDFRLFQPTLSLQQVNDRTKPFGKEWSDKTCLLFVNVMYLPRYFLGISVDCSHMMGLYLMEGYLLFNSGFWTLDSITLYPLVTSKLTAALVIANGLLWLIWRLIKCW